MIGYYVHHHGAGHLRRMAAITRHLHGDVTVLSSLPRPASAHHGWVELARDDAGPVPVDVDAHGTLHWVPRYDVGLGERAAQLVTWLTETRPVLLVVDVSVEVALLARLCGVPVVVVAMPGDRTDRAHLLAYDLAEALLATWPAEVSTSWPQHWVEKTAFVGGVSRFDDRPAPVRSTREARRALLLWGTGGAGRSSAELEALRAETPGWEWDIAGGGSSRGGPELWQSLCDADVVVTHGGQNAVAEVAAARAPAVVVADPRPFAEQEHTLAQLDELGVAVTLPAWPDPAAWPTLLERATTLRVERWALWNPGDGAQRAASMLDTLAARLVPGPTP